MIRAARIALVFCLFGMQPVSGTTWYVDASVPSPGDGSSWKEAFRTIGEAVAKAKEGDTVVVAPGEYSEEESLVIGIGVALRSRDPADPATVRATVIQHTLIQGIFSLSGFTILEGQLLFQRSAVAFTNNVACNGGPLIMRESSPLISGNLIFGNFGQSGGGIHCNDSSPTIINNVIVANRADHNGGGISCGGMRCSPLIANNTIVGNSAGLQGGGIYADESSSPTITNCILWDNGDDLFGCSATYSCVEDGDPGEGNIAFYPHFVDSTGGDYRLSPWSPCIDAADPSSPFSLEPQPNGSRMNMGAYGNTAQATCAGPDLGFDGLPDDWEILHFGHLDYTATDDSDGDGILNIDEYHFGWDPTTPSAAPVRNLTAGRCYEVIQSAIAAAAPGEELVIEPGHYMENLDFLGKALVLRSTEPSDPGIVTSTVVDGGECGSVVSFTRGEGRDSILSGLTITGGRAPLGGGIYCVASSPTVSFNLITYNYTFDVYGATGGGLFSEGGSPLIEHNSIEYNTARNAGAICCQAGRPVIKRNTITWNGPGWGVVVLDHCPFALFHENRITRNHAELGAGLVVVSSQLDAANNVVAFNSSCGISHSECTGVIQNCTIAYNGGVGIAHGHHTVLAPVVSNCIIWGHENDLDGQEVVYSCIQDEDPGEGNIHLDPQFIDRERGDFRLAANSPCINAGNTASALDATVSLQDEAALISWSAGEDADGNPRISGKAVDMGAYEYQEGPPTLQFVLEHSSDLSSWESIEVGPFWQWLDDTLNGFRTRFYRLMPE